MPSPNLIYEIRFQESYVHTRSLRARSLKKDPRWFGNTKLLFGLAMFVCGVLELRQQDYWFAPVFFLLGAMLVLVPRFEKRRGVRIKPADPLVGKTLELELGESGLRWEFAGWTSHGGWEPGMRAHRYADGIVLLAAGQFFWLPDDQVSAEIPEQAWTLLKSKLEGCHDHRAAS